MCAHRGEFMVTVFVTGGTGYMGSRVIPLLLQRNHRVRCVVRPGSENKAPAGCEVHVGNALHAETYADAVSGAHTFLQLVGEPKPNPKKGAQFRAIDLESCKAAVQNAKLAGVQHFVYVSVAHPAPMMHSYIEVRTECEAIISASGLNATILRPWYVLGPGHRWPYALIPFYAAARLVPSLREGATRLGLVTLQQMLNSLVWAVENHAHGTRMMQVPDIRRGFLDQPLAAAS
jgi:uncharacterized protein YbjT (DUF2867 family)